MTASIEIKILRESANDDVVTITEWYVAHGGTVRAQDMLVSIETSKAVMDLEAEDEGYVEILVLAGSEAAVGTVIGRIHPQPLETLSNLGQVKPRVEVVQVQSATDTPPKTQVEAVPLVTADQEVLQARPLEQVDSSARYSKAALALLAEFDLQASEVPLRGLVTEADLRAWLVGRDGLQPVARPEFQASAHDTLGLENQPDIAPPTPESAQEKPAFSPTENGMAEVADRTDEQETSMADSNHRAATSVGTSAAPVGGFFADARKSANERGRNIVWLALNYFFRNYCLGHLARLSPLGINLWIHRLRGVKMGKGVYIDPSATIETAYPENITIGNDVRITANAIIMTHIKAPHDLRNSGRMPLVLKPVVLEDHCFIGVNAVIMPGVRIGSRSVVTSGSVVLSSVPPDVMVTGNPAKIVKRFAPAQHGNEQQ